VPLASLDFLGISIFYAVVKVVLAAAAVLVLSPGVAAGPRVLATLTLVGSLPFVHDVLLGNANVVLVAAMVPALLLAPRMRSGILLGIVAAIFAKPLLAPVLLWLLVWRRPVLGGALVGGLGATGLGVLLAGPANYLDWFWALVGGSRYAAPFVGNHGVSALLPDLWLPVAVVTAIALLWVLARSGPQTGLTWAAASGILLAPYAGTYSALPIALAVPGMLRSSPTAALLIVALSPIATTHPLPFYAAAILLLALRSREARRPGVAAA
jgi:hypothetical protein